MNNSAYPVLCGGTFFTQILQSRKPTTSRRQRTQGQTDIFKEPDVLFGLVQIVNPDYQRPAGDTFRTYTTNYKKCAKTTPNDLKFDNEQVVSAFLMRLATDYPTELNKMTGFVRQFIDIGTTAQKDVLLAKRLIELIRDDKSIPISAQFAVTKSGTAATKGDLVNSTDEIYLPAFLLDLWKFIVTEQKNNAFGGITIVQWQHPTIQGRYIGIDGSTITREIKVKCDVSVPSWDSDAKAANVKDFASATNREPLVPDVNTYLQSAKNKYSTIKTLLYNDQPRQFYDFYVCNNIERKIPVPSNYGTSYRSVIIKNVTVQSLTECSRFVILAGTGGLGKSMMMRHLLLNAVDTYADLTIIPVFIPLKEFDETIDNLFEYVYSKITSLYGGITEEQLKRILEKGKCLLLFDGLDEINSTYARQFERELENFTDSYSENCYVISSRPYQTFVSYSRFTVLQLQPFSKQQALLLIDNLEFRPDEPIIKEKFRTALDEILYRTHNTFIENPLLLTIMLLTFEQYAEVPSKMHIFYREAFAALSVKHDASKGAYKRTLRTGLAADKFADYFAELCSRSYYDEKFEMTEAEFAKYYNVLKERDKSNDSTTIASDYLYDLCSNMCLMYFESGRYHFTHRSFQEYFCAFYFSKQKDKYLESISDFFENRHNRMFGDKTFSMLYDMISDKVEEYIFLPYLTRLCEKCDAMEGYWTFLETLYPYIRYRNGETDDHSYNIPQSYIYDFIRDLNWYERVVCNDFPHYDSLVTEEYAYVIDKDDSNILVNKEEVNWEYRQEYGTPDTVGWEYGFEVESVRMASDDYAELLKRLDDDNFSLKKEYTKMRKYFEKLQVKPMPSSNNLFDLFA